MKRTKTVIVLLLAAILAFCMSCGREQKNEDEEKYSEGTDTPCKVSYTQYSGSFGSMFLSEGDRLAVIAPSAIPMEGQVDAVVKGLEKWGYVPVEGKYVRNTTWTLDECLSDLKWALEDPTIKAVFCVRGGYAASEVMDKMLSELISCAKKLIIGYSDITVYHSAWTCAGLPSVHASMSAAFTDLPEECVTAQQNILKGELPAYEFANTRQSAEGEAEGILIGGNLATLTAVLGTSYDCTKITQPYILFLEDVEEDMENIHRYLTILKHCGVLDAASGIIFGEWTEMPSEPSNYEGESRGGDFGSVAGMIERQFPEIFDVPVAFGFPAGHGDVNYPLLMGEKARLCITKDSVTLSFSV